MRIRIQIYIVEEPTKQVVCAVGKKARVMYSKHLLQRHSWSLVKVAQNGYLR